MRNRYKVVVESRWEMEFDFGLKDTETINQDVMDYVSWIIQNYGPTEMVDLSASFCRTHVRHTEIVEGPTPQ